MVMANLNIRQIRLADPEAAQQLRALRLQLTSQENMVSARGRALTEKVFGEALAPARVVERICTDVRTRGLEAVLHYTAQLDGVRLDPASVRVSAAELLEAHAAA